MRSRKAAGAAQRIFAGVRRRCPGPGGTGRRDVPPAPDRTRGKDNDKEETTQ